MLEIDIPEQELFDEETRTFIPIKATKVRFEHSLVSISKWEGKWKRPFPFLNIDKRNPKPDISNEEMIDYLRCMCLTQNVDPDTFRGIKPEDMTKIYAYMGDSMTATTFSDKQKVGNGKKITNELIYFWMSSYGIWKECEKWHINRLLTLIHVCSAENAPKKKMSTAETYERQRALNAARRKPKVPKK